MWHYSLYMCCKVRHGEGFRRRLDGFMDEKSFESTGRLLADKVPRLRINGGQESA